MKTNEFTINAQLAHQAKIVENQPLLNMRKPLKSAKSTKVKLGSKSDASTWAVV